MTHRERFVAVATGQPADYIPIFGFDGAPGMSGGCMYTTHDRLVAGGMPAHVGGRYVDGACTDVEGWRRYWGTTGVIRPGFRLSWGAPGFKTTSREEGDYIVRTSENGSVTREVKNNANVYSMPEFRVYPVRDRASWEFFRERVSNTQFMDRKTMEEKCRELDDRSMPLSISAGGTFGVVRSLMGTEAASLALYDDPELVHDIIDMAIKVFRRDVAPLIERLRPEAVQCWEDIGYKTGMLIGPQQFREFCAPFYREVAGCARANGVPVLAVDSDGCAMDLVPLLAECGVNALYPFEAHGNNDLFALRERFPEFVMFGWLEKEVVNEGNEHLIAAEIAKKVPPLLRRGRYFPNGDHGIQPEVTFRGLCKFMTLLHEACNNPEGEFPRM